MTQPVRDLEPYKRQRDLIVGLVISLGAAIGITVIGFIGTFAHLLTSGHLHAADRSVKWLYLIAPGLGLCVALIGCGFVILNWVKSKPDVDRPRNESDSPARTE